MSLTSPIGSQVELAALERFADAIGDQHLASLGAADDAVGEVDVGAEVVAVAIDGLRVVDADAWLRPLGEATEQLHRPLGQRARVRRDDHHLVADRLHDRRLGRQRRLDRFDEVLDHVERLQVTLLLGVAGEAGEVDEAERHRDLAERACRGTQLALHVADHVLLEEEAQVAGVQVLGQRRRQRQDVGGQLAHLLGHLQLRHAVADHRFVHVEVEEPHLGVGDPAQRLHVDADQLQEGDQREAGGEHPGAVAQRLDVLRAEHPLAAEGRAEDDQDALDQLRLEAGLARHLLDRHLLFGPRKEFLGEAEGEPALAARPLQVLERVAALAHARNDTGLGRGGGRPAPPPHRHDLFLRPALQRARRDPGPARGLAQRYAFFCGHWRRG